jgi:hypothetical protein
LKISADSVWEQALSVFLASSTERNHQNPAAVEWKPDAGLKLRAGLTIAEVPAEWFG